MKSLTVKDLKTYLATHSMSPEKFAKEVQLSHMTIRRWLKRPDNHLIPEKYYPLLAARLESGFSGFSEKLDVQKMMSEIEESGRNYHDLDQLEGELGEKLKTATVDRTFMELCKTLYDAARSTATPLRMKAIAIGALLYFINPLDLIPDHIPVIGYLDDLVILSLAVNFLTRSRLFESNSDVTLQN